MTTTNLEKMSFRLNPEDWHGQQMETLWVEALGDARNDELYVVRNSPFFARGVSFLDIARGERQDGSLLFSSTIAGSGHSTYRIICDPNSREFSACWAKLQNLGCTYESATIYGKAVYTVDVPETANIKAACEVMEEGQSEGIWIFEEAHYGRLHAAAV